MKNHDYGLGTIEQPQQNCKQWENGTQKKIIMINLWACKNRLTVGKIINRLDEWGIKEVEEAEAVIITRAIVEAINAKRSFADITQAFNVEFMVYDQTGEAGVITKEAISETLYEKLFKKVYEDDEKTIVKMRWRCLL